MTAALTFQRDILEPLADLRAAIADVESGERNSILFPIREARRLVDSIQQTLVSIGQPKTEELTEGVQALHSMRRSVIRLLATPQAFVSSNQELTEELVRAMSEWQNTTDNVSLNASQSGSNTQDRIASQHLLNTNDTGLRQVETRAGDTLPKVSARELGNASRWHEIAMLNGLDRGPFLDAVGGPGKAKWGETLVVPTSDPQAEQGTTGSLEDSKLIQQKAIEARFYGRDIRLFERDGRLDIRFGPDGTLATIAGRDNLLQAVTIKRRVFQGQLLEDPTFGMRRLVGIRMQNDSQELARWATEETILSDPRIKSVKIRLDTQGNVIEDELVFTPVAASDSRTSDALTIR